MTSKALILAALVTATPMAAAESTTLISYPPQYNPYGQGSSVSVFGNGHAYDDFRLSASASIGSLTWWGDAQAAGDAPATHFEISVLGTHNDNEPDTSNVYFKEAVTVDRVGDEQDRDPDDGFFYAYRYTVNFAVPITLPGDTDLFLSIYNTDTTISGAGWDWASSIDGDANGGALDRTCQGWGTSGCSIGESNGDISADSFNLAWQLNDAQGVQAVPELTNWILMVGGLGMVGAMMRRGSNKGLSVLKA